MSPLSKWRAKYVWFCRLSVEDKALSRRDPSQFKGGVCQGCPLSPMLFKLYSELIMIHALEKWEGNIEIVGKYPNNLRYADDVALLATTEDNLQQLVNDGGKSAERFDLSLYSNMIQVKVIDRNTSSIDIMSNGSPWNKSNRSFTLEQALTRKEIQSRRWGGD